MHERFKRSKKEFHNNLNVRKITDNKSFWKTITPNFTDKTLKDERIVLVEDDEIIDIIVESPAINAIKNFSEQPTILKIKEITRSSNCFSFQQVSKENILIQINILDTSKATPKLII